MSWCGHRIPGQVLQGFVKLPYYAGVHRKHYTPLHLPDRHSGRLPQAHLEDVTLKSLFPGVVLLPKFSLKNEIVPKSTQGPSVAPSLILSLGANRAQSPFSGTYQCLIFLCFFPPPGGSYFHALLFTTLISKFKSVSDDGGTNGRTKLEIFSAFMNISAKADKSLQPSNLLSYGIITGPGMVPCCHRHISSTPWSVGQNFDMTPASAEN